ncbi:MAG: 2-octaprenyl-6-methoxyphenyl hydroxylase [Gammaproteobacteria bacterium]|nr:MAG: 2-octaprenyl-6-methoxyphenyl hydroxylase [Gammaproteobacteria bacterium]
MASHYDIAVVGGGLVGSSLVCALASSSYRIALIDSQPLVDIELKADQLDGRSIALALSSKKMLSALGMWEKLQEHATAIKKIHISDQGHFGATRLDSARYEVESFGYLVPADHLIHTLNKQVDALDNVTRIQPYEVSAIENHSDHVTLKQKSGEEIQASLLVAADGANSFIRKALEIEVEEKQYQQSAIVGSVECEGVHNNTAYERFTEEGPLALLPREGNRCGFIWMNPTEAAENHLALSDQAFKDKLQQAFGFRLGHFQTVSKRFAYPLALLMSEQRVQQRVVLIGNAAQTLHPIAGQGLNLALRDIAELVELLNENDLNSSDGNLDKMLMCYARKRQPDIEKTIRFTDRLNFLFNADYPVLKQSRGLGLAMLGAIPVLEERIVKQNLGESVSSANLLRGNAVNS